MDAVLYHKRATKSFVDVNEKDFVIGFYFSNTYNSTLYNQFKCYGTLFEV